MNYYLYFLGENGQEPIGSSGKFIYRNIKRIKQTYGYKLAVNSGLPYSLFAFTNFFDDSTFNFIQGGGIICKQ